MERNVQSNQNSPSESNTQDRLLEAAIDIFGKHGYDAATTRMIAKEANVNIAAIPYYYEGKEGLYRAVIHHVVELISSRLAKIHEQISHMRFVEQDGKEKATELLNTLLTNITMFIVGSPQAARVAPLILREQLFPSSAYDIIFTGFMNTSLNSISHLLMILSGETSKRKATLRAISLLGQILVFRIARETAVRALSVEGYSVEEANEIREIILEHTKSIVSALADKKSNSNKPSGKTL